MKLLGTLGLTVLMAVFLTGTAAAVVSPAPLDLKSANGFVVLAASTITNTGATTISGNVGLYAGTSVTGFSTVTFSSGSLHKTDAVAQQAKLDLRDAYLNANGRTSTTVGAQLGGTTKGPGVYASGGSFGLTGTLTLDGLGNSNAVFIFKAPSTLTTASGSHVTLINGAQAANVFFVVGSSATLGTGSHFQGTILAFSSITLTTGVTLNGRALARNGAVTLDANTITRPVLVVTSSASPTAGSSGSPAPSSTSGSSGSPAPSSTSGSSGSPAPSSAVASGSPAPSSSSASSGSPAPSSSAIASGSPALSPVSSAPGATAAATSTPPPTSTAGSADGGSSPGPTMLLLFAGLAAAGAFVTMRRFDPSHR